MRRTYIPLAGIVAGVASVSAIAGASVPGGHISRATRVGLRSTSVGRILVNGSGSTLYMFTKDSRRRNRCVSIRGCSAVWKALTTRGKPTAGRGVRAPLLSTVRLRGGARQVTYAGHPLYLYSAASEPGQTYYVGVMQFGGKWYALNARGHAVR